MRNLHALMFGVVFLMAVLASALAAAEVTTWTDSSGKWSVEAELVDVKDGKATLRNADGKQVAVPLARLSKASQDYAAEWAARRQSPTGDAVVGLTIQVEEEQGVSPHRFFGFAVADSKGRVAILAKPPSIDPPAGVERFFKHTHLHPAFEKVDVYDLGTGKKLTTASARLFPEETSNIYKDAFLLIPIEKDIIAKPLRIAATPATDDKPVSVAFLSPPGRDLDEGDWSKKHKVQLKKCTREGSSFVSSIARVDGKTITELNEGLPVLNEQGEVVEVVLAGGVTSAVSLPLQDLPPVLEAVED